MRRPTILLLAAILVALLLAATSAFAADVQVIGKAAASTSFSTHQANFMNDGNTSTYWAASSTALPQTARIDLGVARSLSACDIVWRGAPGFRIYGSNDAVSWTELSNRELNYQQTTHTAVKGTYRYVRVRVDRLRVGQAAGIYEWKIFATSSSGTPTPSQTPTVKPTAPATVAPVPIPTPTVAPTTPTPTPVPTVPSSGFAITGLSQASAKVGTLLTISGSGFGASQGTSTVTFGERPNVLGFAPCSKTAAVSSWSNSTIVVTVPGMAPGSQPVYVKVGSTLSNSFGFTVTPVTIISGQTFSTSSSTGYSLAAQHDVLYENCTFTATNGSLEGNQYGVLTMGRSTVYNVTFRNCTITGNTGAGSGGDYGVNGIKMVEGWGTTAQDITFEGCTIGAMSRMGIEIISDGTTQYRNIALRGCTFAPDGAEAISWGSEGAAYSLVDGCTLQGYGNLANPQWGAGFECNQTTNVEVRNTQIWAGKGAALNLNSAGGSSHCNILFDHVGIDMGHRVQTYATDGGARLFGFGNVNYCRLKDCTFSTGTAANHCYNAGWSGGWNTCNYNDFSGSTITGYCGANGGSPTTAAGYWDSGVPSTNKLPALQ